MVLENDDNEVALNIRGGSSFIDLPPLFSYDGESIFVACKNSILEYNTKTGKLIHEYQDLSDRIVGFSYHMYDSYHCLTACSKNGKVIVWKTLTHTKLLEKKLPVDRIKTFSIISVENDELTAFVSYIFRKKIAFTIAELNKRLTTDFRLWIPFSNSFKFSVSKNYACVINENSAYFLTYNKNLVRRRLLSKNRLFTCLSCHPTDEMVLFGDNTGRVILWQNIFEEFTVENVFHWHTLPVQTVSFSPSGSYFYSGGSECVLVKWQIDDAMDRKFVPRIASEIQQITVSNNNVFVAIATKDNAIRIFDNTLNQTTLIQNLVVGSNFDCGMVFDPRTRGLLMNGNQGHVQFYSPEDMSLLYSVDIVGQNKITNERDCVMVNTEITKIALSKSGLWLAIVEERRDEEYCYEIRLKFWHFLEEKQIFELNTSIEYPHEQYINSISFQPLHNEDNLKCVTVGNDKKFKVWQLEDFENVYRKGKVWKCYSVGFHRGLPCMGLSFSVDGSLMAIGFGPILTVWLPDTNDLKCSLIHPIHRETIRHIQFSCRDQCHLLVAASNRQLCVWNLLTLCMVWTVPLSITLLIADPFSTTMAVFSEDKRVFVFNPNSHHLVYASDKLLPKKSGKILTATFFPTKNQNDARRKLFERSHIYFITAKNELYCLGISETITENPESKELDSLFNKMVPNEKINLSKPIEPQKHLYEKDVRNEAIKEFLLRPTHMLPPVRFSCFSLLKSLVIQQETSDDS